MKDNNNREKIRLQKELSGNLTTNSSMPRDLAEKLTNDDTSLKNFIKLEKIVFRPLAGTPNKIKGLNIIAGLQKIKKDNYLTVYRAVRFPTYKRMHEILDNLGCCIANYEQERIMRLYTNNRYIKKRNKIKSDNNFWTQPQERVVDGVPVFFLINDALQIHRAFRKEKDRVMIMAIHIPCPLLKNKKIQLIANTAIDLDYNNSDRDFEINDFIIKDKICYPDFKSLRARGIDLHEMYFKNLPWGLEACKKVGISQEYFLLDVYKIKKDKNYKALANDSKTLKNNAHFMHGFFGDQNVFGRGETKYLPLNCFRIWKK